MADSPYAPPRSELDPSRRGEFDDIVVPAGHGARFGAYFIDGLLVGGGLVGVLVAGFMALVVATNASESDIELYSNLLGLVAQVAMPVGMSLYGAAFESSGWQATPGKRLFGLRVTDPQGNALPFGKAFGRNIAKWVMLSCCGLLALSVLFDERHRGLWDQVVNSRVSPRLS